MYERAVADDVAVSELVTRRGDIYSETFDSATVSESFFSGSGVLIADAIVVSDEVLRSGVLSRSLTQNISVTEAITRSGPINLSLSELIIVWGASTQQIPAEPPAPPAGEYWADKVFPEGKTFILPPSQNYSRGKTVTCEDPFDLTYFPLANATDDSCDSVLRSGSFSEVFVVDLGAAYTPNLFAVINSNLDDGLVCTVVASNSPSLTPALLNVNVAARYPNFWLDLRAAPVSARYWALVVTSNSVAISIGELVVGQAFLFDGILTEGYTEAIQLWGEREFTEYGQLVVSASGAMSRRLTVTVRPQGSTEIDNLAQIYTEVMTTPFIGTYGPKHVVVVPDSKRNDVWFVNWPSLREFEYPASIRETSVALELLEQSGGVL